MRIFRHVIAPCAFIAGLYAFEAFVLAPMLSRHFIAIRAPRGYEFKVQIFSIAALSFIAGAITGRLSGPGKQQLLSLFFGLVGLPVILGATGNLTAEIFGWPIAAALAIILNAPGVLLGFFLGTRGMK